MPGVRGRTGTLRLPPTLVQGYLTHKKTPTPLGLPRTLGTGLR